jgi:hypothetical protein
MIPFDILTELVGIATEPWGLHSWYHVAPPTPQSIERIQQELGITLPEDYVRIAAGCASYGGWLAGIGDDYDHGCHILRLNAEFHAHGDEPPLPQYFVLLNHGHDGDCDCWDMRETTAGGEHPIVYILFGVASPEPSGKRFETFRAYIEYFALQGAVRAPDASRRRQAERWIEALGRRTPET